MYRLLLLVLILIQGCTTIEVGGYGSSVTKISNENYVLRMEVRGARSDEAINKEAEIHGKSLCLDSEFETTRLKSEAKSNMVMVNGMFINTYSEKIGLLISCANAGHKEFIYLAKGEEVEKLDGYSKLRIFNSSNDLMYSDNTGYVYVEVDEYFVVKLPKKQYIDVYLKNGVKAINLSHIDVFKFSGTNKVELNGENINLEVWASPISTKSKVINSLPEYFSEKYAAYLEIENMTKQATGP